jgi:HEAT repeat protein
MSWLPAITVLLVVNAAMLLAIAVASPVRRFRLRAMRTRRGPVAFEIQQALNSSSATERSRAIAERRDVQTFRQALSDPDANLRLTAARRMGEQGIGDDVALVQVLTGIDEQCGRLIVGSRAAQNGPARAELLSIAARPDAAGRLSAIRLLGAYVDSRSRRALVALLADPDARVRGEAAAALGASARLGYPHPLEPSIVQRLIELLGTERSQAVFLEAVDALTYSLDQQVPSALVGMIPSSNGVVRERLIEANALFAHLVRHGTGAVEGASS